jgi:hypothetical protein
MPPVLKQRAVIPQSFIDTMIEMYKAYAREQIPLLQSERARNMQGIGVTLSRMKPIIERKNGNGERWGLDYEITRLRALRVSAFDVIPAQENSIGPWLVVRTKHITLKHYSGGRIMGELGPYKIYVPFKIRQRGLVYIHMIPERNPASTQRHPHHYFQGPNKFPHLLEYQTGNCYGSFSGVLTGLISQLDIPALLQQLISHLSTYGDRPPISDVSRLDFDTNTPEK